LHHILIILKRFFSLVRKEEVGKVFIAIIFIALGGSLGFMFFEKEPRFFDALWWSIVTLTTVGYGDISPASVGGRLVGMVVMISGIGFLGILTAGIAGMFIERKFLENRGMKAVHVEDHFIICGWGFNGRKIVEEIRAYPKTNSKPIVIIADIPEKPLDDPFLYFIHGEVNTETLVKANIGKAEAVIVLSDDRLDAYSRDAKTILTTLTIESVNPDVYTCVELMDEKYVSHCRRARADEIIVVGELSTNLLVQAALNHGLTRMISELVSNRYGEDLYKVPIPAGYAGLTFLEALTRLKERHGILCMGLEDRTGQKFIANPHKDHVLRENDKLIVIASTQPEI